MVGPMTLKHLLVQDLRNLSAVDIRPSSRINLFYGENGSGKTSLLEAVNILGVGRSFRGHKHRALINNNRNAFVVFGRVATDDGVDLPIGICRQVDGSANFKVNGEPVSSVADLANYLPVQVINSDAFSLLDGAPTVRRQFMDWLVFHVEPTFFQLWKKCQRCLKHRNSVLRRDRIAHLKEPNRLELASWDHELILLTEQIHRLRGKWIEKFSDFFYQLIQEFVNIDGITIYYFAGWDIQRPYSEILELGTARDFQLGYTQVSSNRADLKIKVNGRDASEILSRGQQKLLVCALKIAQGVVFSRVTGRKTVYLVDDLPAELDLLHRKLLANWLRIMDTQVFVTGVEQKSLVDIWQNIPEIEIKLFHVEQGRVQEVRMQETVASENFAAAEIIVKEIAEASIEPPISAA
jgi:DNA replication and repair protein RecF